ncbi:MAG: isovaleryl-CoA dehydrogenase [Planctomycetaceae bacterium]|nr:isovaleryl-CoA dehydrogenase [Planctomycetaceae bacterium]
MNTTPPASFDDAAFDELLGFLRAESGSLETPGAWPSEQMQHLARAGVTGWRVPKQWAGSDLSPPALLSGYEKLTQACLVTTFVLTQQDAACHRIRGSDAQAVKELLLPRIVSGEIFVTVGISHLTTSGQHLSRPAVEVRETDRGYVLNGTAPWVSGAVHADYIVNGGTLPDGRQVLAAVPTDTPGLEACTPANMLALNASKTGPLSLNDVEIDRELLIAGPIENVMKHGQGGTGSLTTSAVAIGAAGGSLSRLRIEAENRPELTEILDSLTREHQVLRDDLFQAASDECDDARFAMQAIRKRANSLVVRSAQFSLNGQQKGAFRGTRRAVRRDARRRPRLWAST